MARKRILIIDDEISIRESLSSYLEDEGYRIFTAENGEAGLDIFSRKAIDILITDLKMPKKNGFEVMEAIQELDPDLPMVVISGEGKQEDVIKALRMGAKDYITKPIADLEMIFHVIHKALENKRLVEENRRYRQKLEKSEARYRSITQQMAEGVFTLDALGSLTFTNPAFCRLTGYSAAALCAMNIRQLAAPESLATVEKQLKARKNGIISRYEIQFSTRDNGQVHMGLTCSPMFDDQGRYAGSIAVARDITKLIALREKYQQFLRTRETSSKDMLAICANCKSVRKKGDTWVQVEDYFSHVVFSHGICPACCDALYPGINISEETEFDIKSG